MDLREMLKNQESLFPQQYISTVETERTEKQLRIEANIRKVQSWIKKGIKFQKMQIGSSFYARRIISSNKFGGWILVN